MGKYKLCALTSYILNQSLLKLCKKSGTRETLRNGAEIKDIADILGHSSIKTTENYYILSSKEAQKEVNRTLDEIIKSNIISKIIDYK